MQKNRKPNISYVVKHNLCTGCGICVNSCRSTAINMKVIGGRWVPSVDKSICKNSQGCHKCYDLCPGIGVDLLNLSKSNFDNDKVKEDELMGRYLSCYVGYSQNHQIRQSASSGGVVSHFLIWLLQNNVIDGAVVTRFDKNSPLKVKSYIATNEEDFLLAKGSKYSPVSFHEVLAEVKNSNFRRVVVVGLPCHIQGLRKYLSKDIVLKGKIIGLFSLFCSGSQTINYTDYVLRQCGGNLKNLDYLAYREGNPTGMVAKGKGYSIFKEYHEYNVPMKGIFYPRRCLLCVDMFGELADLSFGDVFLDDTKSAGSGVSAIIARSILWQNYLLNASEDGTLHLKEVDKQQILYKRVMAVIKKTRNASFVQMLKQFNIPAPVYDSKYNGKVSFSICFHYIILRIKQFVGKHKMLWFLLPKIK